MGVVYLRNQKAKFSPGKAKQKSLSVSCWFVVAFAIPKSMTTGNGAAPVTILIDERADGVHLSYDYMAKYLDAKSEGLLKAGQS